MTEPNIVTIARDIATKAHEGKTRKYTGLPYTTHLEAVASLVDDPVLKAVAWLHDTLEDTDLDEAHLRHLLEEGLGAVLDEHVGRSGTQLFLEMTDIVSMVVELTDTVTSKNHPKLNRKMRKSIRADQLMGVSIGAKVVKLADIIDNTRDIVKNDTEFAKVYLTEKRDILVAFGPTFDRIPEGQRGWKLKAWAEGVSLYSKATAQLNELWTDEKIQYAAIKNGADVYTGKSHNEIRKSMAQKGILRDELMNGFVTDKGRFVSRIEAAEIALKSGQVRKLGLPPHLYSDDLNP